MNAEKVKLPQAVKQGDIRKVRELIRNQVSIDTVDEDCRTPLHQAIRCGHLEPYLKTTMYFSHYTLLSITEMPRNFESACRLALMSMRQTFEDFCRGSCGTYGPGEAF